MNYKIKFAVALATGSLFLATLIPGAAFATTNITISGNGWHSFNNGNIIKINKLSVTQANFTSVDTTATAVSNTGGNNANNNTNGNVAVRSGNASSSVSVGVTGNTNINTQGLPCGCDTSSTSIDITGNEDYSTNFAKVVNVNSATFSQDNITMVGLEGLAVSDTGNNKANYNTGGAVGITSGTSTSGISVSVYGSSNSN